MYCDEAFDCRRGPTGVQTSITRCVRRVSKCWFLKACAIAAARPSGGTLIILRYLFAVFAFRAAMSRGNCWNTKRHLQAFEELMLSDIIVSILLATYERRELDNARDFARVSGVLGSTNA